jgi:hypothetical protein
MHVIPRSFGKTNPLDWWANLKMLLLNPIPSFSSPLIIGERGLWLGMSRLSMR